MLKVKFYNEAQDELLKFAVIVAQSNGKWVFCKHKERSTYECPGGHRDLGERIIETARRELWEETGALDFSLVPISIYSVTGNDGIHPDETETFGMLYYSEIKSFGELPALEIERVELFEELPSEWTYPLIQPVLLEKVKSRIFAK